MEGISLPVPVHNTPFWILSQQCSVELAGWRGSSKIYRTTQTSPDLNHTPVMYSKIKPWIIFFYSIAKKIHITQLLYKRTILNDIFVYKGGCKSFDLRKYDFLFLNHISHSVHILISFVVKALFYWYTNLHLPLNVKWKQ